MQLAAEQSRAMAQRDKLDHSVNREFKDRISRSGFDAKVAVENVGAGYHTLAEAFSGWRDSPPHRANMLNSSVTRMGIAAVYAQGLEVQGVLDVDPGGAGRAPQLMARAPLDLAYLSH